MPVGLPIVLEITHHPRVAHFPQQQTVFFNLFEGWLRHEKRARVRP